jgi:hypothetical protein
LFGGATLIMDPKTPVQDTTGLDSAIFFVSIGSLVGSVCSGFLLVPSIGPGLYGGTALMVGMIILLQVVAFVFFVGVPIVVQLFRRRFRMSRAAVWMLAISLTGVVAEVVLLSVIPVTGNC